MAGSLNQVSLIGNLGRDPEIRATQRGSRVANLRLATSESWTDRGSGQRRETTEWHTIVVFNENLVNVVERYATKGTKLFVQGKLQTRKWTDQQGVERYSTEVILGQYNSTLTLLSSRGDAGEPVNGGESGSYGYETPAAASAVGARSTRDDLNDDIPF
jgi:single-strand DNA-binding protein